MCAIGPILSSDGRGDGWAGRGGGGVKGLSGGQWSRTAPRRGLLRVNTETLCRVNACEGISVFTLFHGQPVEAGEVVAKAKVTPLAIASATMTEVERLARGAGVLAVTPFKSLTLGALARESLDDKQRARFETPLTQKINSF